MVRPALGTLTALFLAGAAVAAQPPAVAPAPSNPSHVPHAPDAAPAPAKKPFVGEWRKAYIAKHGHAPGEAAKAPAKAPAKTPAPAKPVANKPVAHPPAHKPLHPYRRCDR